MGGKNVIIVMDDANLELAIDGCLWGGFGTSGQRCTAASRVVVHEKVYERVRRAVRGAGARARGRRRPGRGDPDGAVEQRGAARTTVMKYVQIGKDEGATLACGGSPADGGRLRQGLLPRADDFRRRAAGDADCARGDLRTGRLGDAAATRSTRRSRSRTPSSTGCPRRSTRRTSTAPSPRCATSTPASSTSTLRRSAPRCTCRSAAPRTPGNGHREAGGRGARRVLRMEVRLRRFQRHACSARRSMSA